MEMLIASAFIATILLLVVMLALVLYRAIPRYQMTRELARDSNNALSRISYELRAASQVEVGASSLGATSSVLVLSGVDSGGAAYTATIKLVDGRLMLARNSNNFEALSSGSVRANRFTAYRLINDQSEAVHVILDLVASTTDLVLSRSMQNTIILRGSYVE